ncbi:MAG: hypothetical protein SFX74_11495 [Fimbriimonadaceae bacterium]|nr:hypothetical protein [Fimbriimonadaceae bacterium]
MNAFETPEAFFDSRLPEQAETLRTIDAFIRTHAPNLEPGVMRNHAAYGRYRYEGASGRAGEWFRVGLNRLATQYALYITPSDGDVTLVESARDRLGKVSLGRSCIRFADWSKVNHDTVAELLQRADAIHRGGA